MHMASYLKIAGYLVTIFSAFDQFNTPITIFPICCHQFLSMLLLPKGSIMLGGVFYILNLKTLFEMVKLTIMLNLGIETSIYKLASPSLPHAGMPCLCQTICKKLLRAVTRLLSMGCVLEWIPLLQFYRVTAKEKVVYAYHS